MGSSENDLLASYDHYRTLMENPTSRTLSMEFEGIAETEFAAAVTDPRSAVLEVDQGNSRLVVPLAVSIEHMPWYSPGYFRAKTGRSGPLYYYNNLPPLIDVSPDDYVRALAPVLHRAAEEDGLALSDHAHTDKPVIDRDIGFVADLTGLKTKDLLASQDPPVRHYMYARRLLRTDRGEPNLEQTDFVSNYQAARAVGEFATEKAVLKPELENSEIDEVWQYYDAAFDKLNQTDPVTASFDKDRLGEIMKDPRFLKFVYESSGVIANVCIVTDVRNCPSIMNQAYYKQNFPEAYETGNIYYSPGVVSNPKANNAGMSLSTMGLLIKGFCDSDIDPVITFVCDEVSNGQVPKLSEHSINRTGKLTTDISYPDLFQLFRAFSFKRR